jgi:hypothetical protein
MPAASAISNSIAFAPALGLAAGIVSILVKALDVYRLAQIADRLDVSVDWLLGRSFDRPVCPLLRRRP